MIICEIFAAYSAPVRSAMPHLHAAIGRARLVIAQVNPELPWTRGDTAIEPAAIDVLVPAAVPPTLLDFLQSAV